MNTIVIFSALRKELDPLLKDIQEKKVETQLHDTPYYSGYLKGNSDRIIFGSFGIGKVLASLSTQYLIDRFKPQHIYLIGACGGATKGVNPGDIIVGDSTIQADIDISPFGYSRGEFQLDTEDRRYKEFKTNPKMIKWVKEERSLNLIPVMRKIPAIIKGRIISLDRFETKLNVFNSLQHEFQYVGIDMESAAVNVVCKFNHISYNVIKSVLDMEGILDLHFYHEYFPIVCMNSYSLLKAYLSSTHPF
jgi:adenosylhomocysteine nucleosidase